MNLRTNSIIELAKRYDYEPAHAHQVECMAGTLFAALEPLHKLPREDRKLLEYAAILHDIGYFLTSRRHHKLSMQLIMLEPLPEFSRSEHLVIANIARYHRKTWPTVDHTPYAIMTDGERRRVDMMAPLLRIADALDAGHSQVVQELECMIHPDGITLQICASSDAAKEAAAVGVRSEMFSKVYGYEVKVEVTHYEPSAAGAQIRA